MAARLSGISLAARLLAGLALMTGLGAGAQEAVIHVSPTGNDAWQGGSPRPDPGLKEGPVQTLARAQTLARQASGRVGGPRRPVRVVLQPGSYELPGALLFEPEDSGTADAPVVYESPQPGAAVISGGRVLVPLPGDGALRRFRSPADSFEQMRAAGQLFVDGRRAVLARHPGEGQFWFVSRPVPVPGETGEPGREAFEAPAEAARWLAGLSPGDRARAVLNVYSSWSAGRHRLADGAPPGAVRIRPRVHWPFLKFGPSQRFFIENVPAALDAPGEWVWAGEEVRYLPRPGEAAGGAATLPALDRLLVVRGDASRGQWVEHLRFRGLAFRYARSLTPPDGMFDVQAAVNVGAAIEVDGARHVEFSTCEVSRTGGYGIWLRQAVRDSTVTGCHFHDLGAGAVKVGEAARKPGDPTATGANRIVGNTVRGTGHVYPGAVGVWVGQSFDNVVSYNTVTDTTYTAISLGWTWGYGEATSGRNRVVGNLLYNIGQGMLSDLGAIYNLGISEGTVISDNLIREVRSYPGYGPGAWGIYLDEGSSRMRVERNVVVGTDSGGLHLHFGRDNAVVGNVFARGDAGELLVTRSEPQATRLEVRDNLFVPIARVPFVKFATAPDVRFGANWVSDREVRGELDLAACGVNCQRGAARVDVGPEPRAVSLAGADTGMAAMVTRVATAAGRPDAAVAGVAAGSFPAPSLPPVAGVRPTSAAAPSVVLRLDLASGERPLQLNYAPRNDATAIRVLRDASAPGGACLLFQDGPGFAFRFEPYAFANLNYVSGTAVVEFAARIDAEAAFVIEGRDNAQPFRTGPSLRLSAKGVEVGGRILDGLRPGEWHIFRIEARLGGAPNWRLAVTTRGGGRKVFDNLAHKSQGWSSLLWLGFISDAAVASQACLAEVAANLLP